MSRAVTNVDYTYRLAALLVRTDIYHQFSTV